MGFTEADTAINEEGVIGDARILADRPAAFTAKLLLSPTI
jgi:hypothetical protein